jgi:hypothetical protein
MVSSSTGDDPCAGADVLAMDEEQPVEDTTSSLNTPTYLIYEGDISACRAAWSQIK